MKKIKHEVFNLKRFRAGYYESPDGKYYVFKSDDGWWCMGERHKSSGNVHIEDYKTYAHARTAVWKLIKGENV